MFFAKKRIRHFRPFRVTMCPRTLGTAIIDDNFPSHRQYPPYKYASCDIQVSSLNLSFRLNVLFHIFSIIEVRN